DSRIEYLLGEIEAQRGNLPEAIRHLERAANLDPANLKAVYALAGHTERQATDTGDAEAQRLYEGLLDIQPNNLDVLLQVSRLAAKRGDRAALTMAVERLARLASSWPEPARAQMSALQEAA